MILPEKFRMWLYNNIDYIIENIGKEDATKFLIRGIREYTNVRVYGNRY